MFPASVKLRIINEEKGAYDIFFNIFKTETLPAGSESVCLHFRLFYRFDSEMRKLDPKMN